MREFLPYLVIAIVVAAAFLWKRFKLKMPAASGATASPAASPATPAGLSGLTSSDLFALAQTLARAEAHKQLDERLAKENSEAARAFYQAPFSGPPAGGTPSA